MNEDTKRRRNSSDATSVISFLAGSAGNLKQHEILHTRKTNLRQHNRTRLGEKPFECKGDFKIYERSHSCNMKPIKIEQHESCFRICDLLSDIKQEVQY